MKKFEVKFRVDGKPWGSIVITAPNSMSARSVALAEINGQYGYADKKIMIMDVREIR